MSKATALEASSKQGPQFGMVISFFLHSHQMPLFWRILGALVPARRFVGKARKISKDFAKAED